MKKGVRGFIFVIVLMGFIGSNVFALAPVDLDCDDYYPNEFHGEQYNYNVSTTSGVLTADIGVTLDKESNQYKPEETVQMTFVVSHIMGCGDGVDGNEGLHDLRLLVDDPEGGEGLYETEDIDQFDIEPGENVSIEVKYLIPEDAVGTIRIPYILEDWGIHKKYLDEDELDSENIVSELFYDSEGKVYAYVWMRSVTVEGEVEIYIAADEAADNEDADDTETEDEEDEEDEEEDMTLTITSTEGGASTFEGSSRHSKGSIIDVNISPEEGYEFIRWEGDVAFIKAGETDPYNFDVYLTENVTLHAVFELLDKEEEIEQKIEEEIEVTSIETEETLPEGLPVKEEVSDIKISQGVLDQEVAATEEIPVEMPKTGGIPSTLWGAIGTLIIAIGYAIKK